MHFYSFFYSYLAIDLLVLKDENNYMYRTSSHILWSVTKGNISIHLLRIIEWLNMKPNFCPKVCSTGRVETRNVMENSGKVRVSLPELDLELKLPEQHTAPKGANHMCKGAQHPSKGIIHATVTIYSFFLHIQIARKRIMWYHVIH